MMRLMEDYRYIIIFWALVIAVLSTASCAIFLGGKDSVQDKFVLYQNNKLDLAKDGTLPVLASFPVFLVAQGIGSLTGTVLENRTLLLLAWFLCSYLLGWLLAYVGARLHHRFTKEDFRGL